MIRFERISLRIARIALAATLAVVAIPGISGAQQSPTRAALLRLTDPPVTLATECDLALPIAFVNVQVTNAGTAAVPARTMHASDRAGALAGDLALDPMDAGATLPVHVPLRAVAAPSTNGLDGDHHITLTIDGTLAGKVVVTIPPALCASVPAATGEQGTFHPHPSSGTMSSHDSGRDAAIAQNAPRASITDGPANRGALFAIAAPANLSAARGGSDCVAHLGTVGALVCPDMVKSGNLLLQWDWTAGSGPAGIDGYRIYHTNGITKLPALVTTVKNPQQTLAELPKAPGGYAGRCYTVTAFSGAHESVPGNEYCAGQGATATTVVLPAIHVRTSARHRTANGGYGEHVDGIAAGATYSESKALLGDRVNNTIYRSGFAFDASTLLGRKLVSATLRADVVSPPAGGAACAPIDVVPGEDRWWENADWIAVSDFGPVLPVSLTSSSLSADVTQAVKPWFVARLEFGLVLRGEDENLGAFTNTSCVATFANPRLEVTYY